MMRSLKVLKVCLCLVFVAGCTQMCQKSHKKMSPEEVVEAYLNISLNMTSTNQRELLLRYSTGPLYEAVAQVSDETIRKAYIDKTYDLESYSFVERLDRTPREVEITFILKYKEFESPDEAKDKEKAAEIKTENTVVVVKEKELWKIRNVLNKKTSFDFPLSLGAEIKAKVPPPGAVIPDDDEDVEYED